MKYGNLLGFLPDATPSAPAAQPRPTPASSDAPKREAEKSAESEAQKTPSDYTADAFATVFGGTRKLAENGVKVKLELPCPDCVMEMARAMAGG
jgi:hypothetical protein